MADLGPGRETGCLTGLTSAGLVSFLGTWPNGASHSSGSLHGRRDPGRRGSRAESCALLGPGVNRAVAGVGRHRWGQVHGIDQRIMKN